LIDVIGAMKSSNNSDMKLDKYQDAMEDLVAGRNLHEAVCIFYNLKEGRDTREIRRRIAMHTGHTNETARTGEKLQHPALGQLIHDGDKFVGKHMISWTPKSEIEVHLETDLAKSASVAKIWKAFARRETKLRGEIEVALVARYNELRQLPYAKLKRLKNFAAIWKTLGGLQIEIGRRGRSAEISLFWVPQWEPEHGVTIYLTPTARIHDVE
jgi:hypothetical protein